MILTLDLGTSTTKAVVWAADGPRSIGRAPLQTDYPGPDRAEQDPAAWWPAVVAACAAARAAAPEDYAAVEAIALGGARQTLVLVSETGEALGPALLWSDRRATAEAAAMAEGLGGVGAHHRRTGAVLDGAAVAAKAAWLAAHEPHRWAAGRYLLTPRDFVLARLSGAVVTDPTMVSAAGLVDGEGRPVAALTSLLGDRLPPVVAPASVAGGLLGPAAAELELAAGLPVVVGAGDRAGEVLGSAADGERPMVSWGTTANVSVPLPFFPDPVPDGLVVTAGARGGHLVEGGLSAAGSLVGWLAALTGLGAGDLMARAAAAPAGAGGVVVLPWWGGARAPWWRAGATGAVAGLRFDHDAGHLARAVLEAVAFEVRRCLEAGGARATSLVLTGAAGTEPWPQILSAVTALPARRRHSGQAASAGAALLAAAALGLDYQLDELDPVVDRIEPDRAATARYAALGPRADAVAEALLSLAPVPEIP